MSSNKQDKTPGAAIFTGIIAGGISFVQTLATVPNLQYIDEGGAGVGAMMTAAATGATAAGAVLGGAEILPKILNPFLKCAVCLGFIGLTWGAHELVQNFVENQAQQKKESMEGPHVSAFNQSAEDISGAKQKGVITLSQALAYTQ